MLQLSGSAPSAAPLVAAESTRPGTLGTGQPGALLFARFAFPPNALGLCGPDSGLALPEHVRARREDEELRRLAQGFEGAWPYLELIAAENDVPDPLDARVVEAYWLGNDYLGHVAARAHHRDLETRFRDRAGARDWRWLEAKADSAARVHHSFHVLEVLPRIGLIRGGLPADMLGVLERCLIRPGRVERLDDAHLEVSVPPLEMVDGRLRLGEPRVERLAFGSGEAYGDDLAPGDLVALHWARVCGRLSPLQAARLRGVTDRNIAVANTTI
jgi:hypothetical protein